MRDSSETTIFADECGYTGRALLDPAQPVFVLATLRLNETEALRLKREFFAGQRTRELKHQALSRRPIGQRAVVDFLRWIGENQQVLGFAFVHKEYALVAKMVDLILEPWWHLKGRNLYERGKNIALANLTYYILRSIGGEAYLHQILESFQTLVRHPSVENLDAFSRCLNDRRDLEVLDKVLEYYRLSLKALDTSILSLLDASCLEITRSVAFAVISGWAERGASQIRLVQDQSSELAREKDLWDAVVSPTAAAKQVGWDRRTTQYPLGVVETVLASSDEWAGIQLADVLAGAITRAMRASINGQQESDSYAGDISREIGEWACMNCLWPSADVDPVVLGTEGPVFADPIEHIAAISRSLHQRNGR